MPQPPSSEPLHPQHQAKLKHLQQLSYFWDNALGVPGTRLRLGLESLIGFLPFGGDAVGVILSCYIVWRATEFNLPPALLRQMLSNLLVDGLVGTIPMLGDFFDVTWKANTRNVRLLEAHLQMATPTRRMNRGVVLVTLLGVAVILLGLIAASLWVMQWLWQRIR